MFRQAIRDLTLLVPRRARSAVAQMAALSLAAGLLEATLLVLVVNVALLVTEGSDVATFSLPIVGDFAASRTGMLQVAGASGVAVLGLHFLSARLAARMSSEALRGGRDRIIRGFSRASWARQSLDREGSLQEAVGTLARQASAMVITFSNLVAGMLGLAALIVSALLVDPVVTGIVFTFGVILFAALRPITRLTRSRSTTFVEGNSSFAEEIGRWVTLAMELRSFGVDEIEAERLARLNESTSQAMYRTQFLSGLAKSLYRDVAILFLVGAVASLSAMANDVELASVGAVVLLIIRSLTYAQMVHSTTQALTEQRPNLEMLMQHVTSLDRAVDPVGRRSLDMIRDIELVGVTYAYEASRSGIEEVSFRLERGGSLGLIGPSGSGKSTLVQVLLRLRRPTAGAVLVSGVPYEEYASEAWHRKIAFVPQDSKLFEGTIAENIAFLRPGIDRASIERAARAAHVIDDIEALPDGFETRLGPRGSGLSGGQSQRVAIARALAGQPELLVLDEPTSALDVRSENLFQETIQDLKGEVTMVIIAHRLTTLRSCDRVIALEGGKLQTIGSLEEAARRANFIEEGPASALGVAGT